LLPVSGVTLAVREPTGEDEVFVVETALAPLPAMVELASRVASAADGSALDWGAVAAVDLEAGALLIRRAWLGDLIRTEALCPDSACRERIDVSFGIEQYISHRRSLRRRNVLPAGEDGWYVLRSASARFRVPRVADVLEAMGAEQPALALAERCVEGDVSGSLARRIDRALEALAPRLEGLIGGRCPACDEQVTLRFDPLGYVLDELREAFGSIQLETHTLASTYGWSEAAILALPRARRQRYVDLIEDERTAA
jgi:hypothetical protein